MFKSQKKRFASLLLALALIFTTGITAYAETTLDITSVKQAKTNWCWAAVAQMIGNYLNSNSSRTQWDVVAYIKDSSYPNDSATPNELKKAIRYASKNTVTYTWGAVCSWSKHTSNISAGYPIAIWLKMDVGKDHIVLCSGTKTSGGNNYLYIIDPDGSNESKWYRYDSLKNGTSIGLNSGSYYLSFWKN